MTDFKRLFYQLANIGNTKAGRNCLAYSSQEDTAHHCFIRQLNALGIPEQIDVWGNTYGTFYPKGTTKQTAVVAIGSHLDSVTNGGVYDGVLGVAAGVAVLQSIIQLDKLLTRPLRIIAWRGEESSRFKISCIGSKGAAGKLSIQETKQFHDSQRNSLYQSVIKRSGPAPSPVERGNCHTLLEMHIEQGPILSHHRQTVSHGRPPIGVVTQRIAGAIRLQIHCSALPIKVIAELILAVHRIALGLDHQQRPFRATFTPIDKPPNIGRDQTLLRCRNEAQAIAAQKQVQSTIQRNGLELILSGPHTFHTGSQPMHMRDGIDQIVAAAQFITSLPDASDIQWPQFMINDSCHLQLDIRGGDSEILNTGLNEIQTTGNQILKHYNSHAHWQIISRTEPAQTTPEIANLLIESANQLSIPVVKMASGAGHDVQVPSVSNRGLVFVASEAGGVSHHNSELTHMADARAGLSVLEQAVYQLLRQ
ncbi:MAG: M20/M25/M40 family metallo-hydrolase [Magnetococcales bacterium]|nr:M20/M25/M40 family metallo-hydrolase [Magnetococcales bacterium]